MLRRYADTSHAIVGQLERMGYACYRNSNDPANLLAVRPNACRTELGTEWVRVVLPER